jgi:hypothetical protein
VDTANILRNLAFILYRQHYQAMVVAHNPGLANPEISKIIGEQWRSLSEDDKSKWKALAEVRLNDTSDKMIYKTDHLPGGESSSSAAISRLPLPTSAVWSGWQCPQCGLRYWSQPIGIVTLQ